VASTASSGNPAARIRNSIFCWSTDGSAKCDIQVFLPSWFLTGRFLVPHHSLLDLTFWILVSCLLVPQRCRLLVPHCSSDIIKDNSFPVVGTHALDSPMEGHLIPSPSSTIMITCPMVDRRFTISDLRVFLSSQFLTGSVCWFLNLCYPGLSLGFLVSGLGSSP